MEEQGSTENAETPEKVTTVAGAVLKVFFDELAQNGELSDIASNLRKLVLEDGVFAEPAIRAILFPDAP